MFVLRCTAKMLKGFEGVITPDPGPSETLLGDWYANIVRWRRLSLVVFGERAHPAAGRRPDR